MQADYDSWGKYMNNATIRYIFLLMALLIAVAYFVGLSTDLNSFINGLVKLWYVGTGRSPSTGAFASYPSGAPTSLSGS
jgi:hypothetical protein